jgi:hypothetical protein
MLRAEWGRVQGRGGGTEQEEVGRAGEVLRLKGRIVEAGVRRGVGQEVLGRQHRTDLGA